MLAAMGFLDDLKKSIAERAARDASTGAAKALGKSLEAAVNAVAEDVLGDAEQALTRARAERGHTDAAPEVSGDSPSAPPRDFRAEREARKRAAIDELAQLKAARDGTPTASPRKKTL